MSTCKWTATAGEIEALSITIGSKTLTIYDVDTVPDAIDERTCPVMFPDTAGFITNFSTERSTMGPAANAMHTFRYQLNYFVVICKAGARRGLKDVYSEEIATAEAIITKITVTDDAFTVANIEPGPASGFGVITDASGQQFHGFGLSFTCEEFE